MATNGFSPEFLTEINRKNVRTLMLAEFDSMSGKTYLHTGTGVIQFNGQSFTGYGNMTGISPIGSEGGTAPKGVDFSLSSLSDAILKKVIDEKLVGFTVKLWFAVLEPDNKNIKIAELAYSGFVSSTGVSSGDENVVTVSTSSRFERWASGLADKFSYESHLHRNPNDHRFRYIAQTASAEIKWGTTVTANRFRYD